MKKIVLLFFLVLLGCAAPSNKKKVCIDRIFYDKDFYLCGLNVPIGRAFEFEVELVHAKNLDEKLNENVYIFDPREDVFYMLLHSYNDGQIDLRAKPIRFFRINDPDNSLKIPYSNVENEDSRVPDKRLNIFGFVGGRFYGIPHGLTDHNDVWKAAEFGFDPVLYVIKRIPEDVTDHVNTVSDSQVELVK